MSVQDILRIKIKLGENEFEAEGPPNEVKTQVATFERLLGRPIETPLAAPSEEHAASEECAPSIKDVARAHGKVVSLSVDCQSSSQAVLAMLLGHKELRAARWVSGSEIMAGLRASGHQIVRADSILKRHATSGHVVIQGKHRLKRYGLTTDGIERAQTIAQSLARKKMPGHLAEDH
jgi:hypothetical protein